MEWVAHIAGEHHSDAPVCVPPVLRHFGIALNDWMPDDWRQKLRPYLARMIGTAGDGLDQQRLYLLADWAVRVILPMGLDARGRGAEAQKFRDMPPVADKQSAARAAWAAEAAEAAEAAKAAEAAEAAEAAVWQSTLDVLDRLLPTETLDLPAEVERRAALVCGA